MVCRWHIAQDVIKVKNYYIWQQGVLKNNLYLFPTSVSCVFVLAWLLQVLVHWKPEPWNRWLRAKDHGKACSQCSWLCLAGLLWSFRAGPCDADTHQSLVGAWWSGLSQKEESCSHPDKVILASCHYPLDRQGKSIPIRQPLVPSRDQLPTSKGQTVSGHEWSQTGQSGHTKQRSALS